MHTREPPRNRDEAWAGVSPGTGSQRPSCPAPQVAPRGHGGRGPAWPRPSPSAAPASAKPKGTKFSPSGCPRQALGGDRGGHLSGDTGGLGKGQEAVGCRPPGGGGAPWSQAPTPARPRLGAPQTQHRTRRGSPVRRRRSGRCCADGWGAPRRRGGSSPSAGQGGGGRGHRVRTQTPPHPGGAPGLADPAGSRSRGLLPGTPSGSPRRGEVAEGGRAPGAPPLPTRPEAARLARRISRELYFSFLSENN